MSELLWILGATFLVSLISFIGAASLALSEKLLKKIMLALVGFAAGALIGGAFLHLLPESIEKSAASDLGNIFLMVVVGFIIFFFLEKLLWRHCHEKDCPIHVFAYLNLFGDGVHNFIGGLVMAASFVVGIPLGLVTTGAIVAHEIPQEMGDFGVLVYGGLKPRRALLLNFITALTAIAGGIAGYFLFPYLGGAMIFLLPFAAGGFLYIAASDLVPELHKEPETAKTVASFASFLGGIILMWGIKLMFGG
ncbi:MAG: ZIP family metal transporter [Candidatus Hadarchaeaceae archaeon]